MTDRYAVIGNPIAHSKSPAIHAAFAHQTGQDMRYDRILGDLEHFEDDLERFFADGGQGMNVTVPFKERAFRACAELGEPARHAGAVNTLSRTGSGLRGDNTDGVGLVRDIACNQRFELRGARILLLGAGGAARGVLLPLLDERPAQLLIANRTAAKAVDLARTAADLGPVSGCGLDAIGAARFDLVVNATAAGLDAEVPAIPDACLAPGGWTYDMLYADEPTAFVQWGRQHGAARALDGLGMLVEQAAESFRLWRGVTPDTAAVIQSLRAS